MFNTTNAPKGGREERVVPLFHIRQENHQHSETALQSVYHWSRGANTTKQ